MSYAHTPALLSIARRIAGSADAEDAVQNAMVRAWLKQRQFHQDCPWTTWVSAIVRNEALRIVQHRAVAARHDFVWHNKLLRYAPDTPEQLAIAAELGRTLDRVLRIMPPAELRAMDQQFAGMADNTIAFMHARTRARQRLRAAGIGGSR